MTRFHMLHRDTKKRVLAMPVADEEPEVRNLILFAIVALCVAKEVVSLWSWAI